MMVSPFRQTRVYLGQSVQFYLRTRRFIFFLILIALITAIVYALIGTNVVKAPAEVEGFDTFFFSFIGDIVIILGAFLGGDAMASDFSLKTGTFVLSQPSKRSSILLGRYIGALFVGVAIISLYYVLGIFGMLYLYRQVPLNVGESYLLTLLYVSAAIALGFLFSSMFKNGSTAIVTAIIVMLLVFSIVTGVLDITNIEAWFILSYGGGVATYVLLKNYPAHATQHATVTGPGSTLTVTAYVPYVWEGIAIMAGYLVICLVISILIYNRRQI